ncbi:MULTISPECIES: hypothetical protein [unclassified Streptomyces]|uniref:hypothetical protein n=1 Tax=unclassified Streptomyces TaxID=2593676 RepID=UPI0023669A01|nr:MULTISPECIES: hypothetical protein [unclassified Streptomyces]MDF3140697.1 hypothetical protein [Streptomyces sp. T21Q-yed]WDF40041.1 hypothetical protein PBV52_26290 [Streptomyces sp. T12]
MRTKTSAALIACAIAAGSVMFSAPAASAAAYCDSSGYTAIGLPIERCTSLSNGVLVHKKDYNNPTKLWTHYGKTGGSTVSVRLGYSLSGSTTYSSYFSISSGQTVTKYWEKSGSYMCYNSVGVLNYSGGTDQTPAAHC